MRVYMAKGVSLVIVVAVADNGVIGAKGGLPWSISADLKRVKELTTGKPLLMGRKTYDSIGRPLPGRKRIVLTSDPNFSVSGVSVFRRFAKALNYASELAVEMNTDQIIAFGGESIYAEALPYADKIYKTEVHCSPVGDAYFPQYNKAEWSEMERLFFPAGNAAETEYSFVRLDRILK
jgi:dihydrofolate reductase